MTLEVQSYPKSDMLSEEDRNHCVKGILKTLQKCKGSH